MRAFLSSPASRALALLAVVSSAAGCATKGDLRNVRTEIRQLRATQDSILAELVRQRRMTADTLGNQSRTLSNLQGSVSQQLRDIADGVDQLRELAGQNSRDIAGIRDQMAAMARSGRGAPAGEAPGGVGLPGETVPSTSPDSLFEAANDAYNR
ncbi:MAG TPA: hypothetical protein VE173_00825, partial [Longimicrobiales bacterium]|nr:hypothetical protein [Longimicrobiales bacterium]